ncbi:MAG: isoleucine--tRNA ligase [Helicobacteraceae bacterium]|jgi:isoleucyl-tRNA synthetase|nr:isoleucine--tRNA ligase [Helicobacteraceae bacterium]
MEYKNTLFLPQTRFAMRADLTQNEPKRYQKWADRKIYDKMKALRKGAPLWTFHDGPPYANGAIHIGHALNKILKDIIVKFHYFQGFDTRFTPGWDCHGLPIEQQVETALGKDKAQTSKAEIRRLCRAHAAKYARIQQEGFASLGVIADWEKPYITMDYNFEAQIYKELVCVAKAGLLIERKKPVYWSWAAQSALAEAEVEYQDKKSDSIFVAFALTGESCAKLGIKSAKAVIWTTTPWTLPANAAIALKSEAIYALTSDGFIAAKERLAYLRSEGVIGGEAVKEFAGAAFERLEAVNPLNNRKSLLILGDHVSMEDGTGLVHTAPGHGEDDYRAGLKYDLEVIMPVDERGCFDQSVVSDKLLPDPQSFVGMHIFKANEIIIEKLGGALLKRSEITHSYPHCWRTRKPVIYRATKQWFIAMDEPYLNGKTLRETALAAIEGVKFYPQSGRNRLRSMIETRPDWCISRQRDWGVPIAFLRDKTSGEVLLDDRVLDKTAAIFEREGCDSWVTRPVADFLIEGYDPDGYEKVADILDVWFDSGSTQSAVLRSGDYDAGEAPADMYLEGSDQHRGWFQSSLLVSCAARGEAPYKTILTHGFTVDEKGEKMSKSKGNGVDPSDVVGKMGAEILRLWVAMSDYRAEVKISQNILNQIADQYKKLRNTFRFMLANIEDLTAPIDAGALGAVDRWILSLAKRVSDEALNAFKEYDFAKAFHLIHGFVVSELSGVYLDMVKDRVYCDRLDSPRRRSAQTAIYHIARTLLTLIAPALTYTADEIAEFAPPIIKQEGETIFDLLHKTPPSVDSALDAPALLALRERFFAQVDNLKKSGVVKNTLELGLIVDPALKLDLPLEDLADWLTISWAKIGAPQEAIASGAIASLEGGAIVKSDLHKCPRCWKYVCAEAGEPCDRCKSALEAIAKDTINV